MQIDLSILIHAFPFLIITNIPAWAIYGLIKKHHFTLLTPLPTLIFVILARKWMNIVSFSYQKCNVEIEWKIKFSFFVLIFMWDSSENYIAREKLLTISDMTNKKIKTN